MKLLFALTGRFDDYIKEKQLPLKKATTLAMQEVATEAKDEVRAQVRANFKRTPAAARKRGQNFEKSFRADAFPNPRRKKFSLNPAAVVQALARFAGVFEKGAEATGVVIPLPAARKLNLDRSETGRGQFTKRSDIEAAVDRFGMKGGLVSVPIRGGFMLGADRRIALREGLRVKRGFNMAPLFLLLNRVRIPKKLDFMGAVRRAQKKLPAIFDRVFQDG
jgi:hypothetical protein